MEMESLGHRKYQLEYTDAEIEHALEPTPENGPWRSDFESEETLDEFKE